MATDQTRARTRSLAPCPRATATSCWQTAWTSDCDSNTGSGQEPGASSSAAPRCDRGDLIPADGVFDGSKPQRRVGIYDGDDDELDSDCEYHRDFQPYEPPATENLADFYTARAPATNDPERGERHTRMIINLGDSSPEVEHDDSTQVQAEAEVDETEHEAAIAQVAVML
jgi:hypothetical protein